MNIIQRLEFGSLDLTDYPYSWEFGGSFGSADRTYSDVLSGVMDGALVSSDRRENREIQITILIEGADFYQIQDAENALSAECDKVGNALAFFPDLDMPPTVFDTFQADMVHERTDEHEQNYIRRYSLTIPARPFPRSANLTVTPAETDALDVLVDDGSSTAGWAVTSTNGSPSVSSIGGVVTASWNPDSDFEFGGTGLNLRRTGVIDVSATKYLQVDWRESQPMTHGFSASAGGFTEARRDVLSGGWQRTFYRVPDAVTSVEWLNFYSLHPKRTGADSTFEVDQIRRLSRLPFSATTRQKTTAIYPGGSAPAEGSLHIYHDTESLGRTAVHTYPLGRPSPALMQHRASSETLVPDGGTLNGQYVPVQSQDLVLNVPDFALPIRGSAALWGKLQVNSDPVGTSTLVSIKWTVQPWNNGVVIGPIEEGTITIEPGDGGRVLLPLALVTLPPTKTGISGSTVITLRRVSGTANVYFDEVWAFGQDDESATTIVDCGEGTPTSGGASNHLWINAPTPDAPAGEVLIGTDPIDARWPMVLPSNQLHKFPNAGVAVLVASATAPDMAIELAHYRRWTHHAGD